MAHVLIKGVKDVELIVWEVGFLKSLPTLWGFGGFKVDVKSVYGYKPWGFGFAKGFLGQFRRSHAGVLLRFEAHVRTTESFARKPKL